MDTQLLLKKPESAPKVEPKVTKIDTLSLISKDTKKTSDKLRKIFEKGTYQKKTQLTILNRYKKKLDRLEKQENDRRKKRERAKVKFQTPKIKQFKGSFFDAKSSDNPLKALGLLAAFNAVDSTIKGDFSKAIGPALVAGGIFLGPSLLKIGVSKLMKPKGPGATPQTGAPVSKVPWWEKNTRSLSRSNQSYARFISKEANIGDKARLLRRGLITPRQALSAGGPEALSATTKVGRVSKAFAKFGGSIIPGVGAIVGAADATLRAQAGDVTGSAIAGTAAGLDAFAAASAATGIGLPLAGLASIASFALDLTNLVRDLSGMSASEEIKNKDRLKQQTDEQKKIIDKSKEERQQLTFSKTLNSYEKSVNKFEEFSKAFKFGLGETQTEGYSENITPRTPTQETPYTGPVSGETFIPLPGATSIGDPNQGQNYGAGRGGRSHAGVDLTETTQRDSRSPIVSYKTGKIIKIETGDIYPGGAIEVDHGGGLETRYLHVTPDPGVKVGDTVYGGQQIGRLHRYYRGGTEQTHLHFEVYQNGKLVNPTSYVTGAKNKIPSPLTIERARQLHEKSLQGTAQPGVNTLQRQQSPEEFFKGTNFENIFKDKGKVDQFYGQKPGGFEGQPIKVTTTDPNVKQAQEMYNAYVRDLRSRKQVPTTQQRPASVAPPVVPIPPAVRNIRRNLPYQEQYVDSTPIVVPIPIPRQSRSQAPLPSFQGVMVMTGPSEEELLNSFYKRVLLNTLQ